VAKETEKRKGATSKKTSQSRKEWAIGGRDKGEGKDDREADR